MVLDVGITSLKTGKSEKQLSLNAEGIKNPQVGDYWSEMFAPIAVVVARPTDENVLICRKTTSVDADHWTWDVASCEVLRLKEFAEFLSYKSIPGCWADVSPKKMEWVKKAAMLMMFGKDDAHENP